MTTLDEQAGGAVSDERGWAYNIADPEEGIWVTANTLAEALEQAVRDAWADARREGDVVTVWIGRTGAPVTWASALEGYWLGEHLAERLMERWGEAPGLDYPSREAEEDLRDRLRGVVSEWEARHDLGFGWHPIEDIEEVRARVEADDTGRVRRWEEVAP